MWRKRKVILSRWGLGCWATSSACAGARSSHRKGLGLNMASVCSKMAHRRILTAWASLSSTSLRVSHRTVSSQKRRCASRFRACTWHKSGRAEIVAHLADSGSNVAATNVEDHDQSGLRFYGIAGLLWMGSVCVGEPGRPPLRTGRGLSVQAECSTRATPERCFRLPGPDGSVKRSASGPSNP